MVTVGINILLFIFFVSPRPTGFQQSTKVSPIEPTFLSRTNHRKLLLSETQFSKYIPLPNSFILLYKTSKTNSQMNFCQPYLVNLIYKLKLKKQGGPKWSKTIVLKSFVSFPLRELDIFKHLNLCFILIYYLENCHDQAIINWCGQKTN